MNSLMQRALQLEPQVLTEKWLIPFSEVEFAEVYIEQKKYKQATALLTKFVLFFIVCG